MSDVVVIGAGFSGLVAAWQLQKNDFNVTVIEKTNHVGGMISTTQNVSYGIVETAANGLLCSALTEELFRDCGLEIQVPQKQSRRRFIAVDGEVSRWPLGIIETLQFAINVATVKRSPPRPAENLYDWAVRALGEPAAEKLVAPAMLGIYAADAKILSAGLIVGKFLTKSEPARVRGRIKGTVACAGGLGSLLKSLRVTLENRGVKFQMVTGGVCAMEAAGVRRTPVVIATPAWEAKSLIPEDPRAQSLMKIKSVPLVTITAFFKHRPPRTGFGTLFSQSPSVGEPDGILGSLQNSEIFSGRAKPGIHSETWILGGATHGDKISELSDDELLRRVVAKRNRWIDSENPVASVVTKWPRAIPLYSPELEALIPDLKKDANGVVLFGNYLGELGLSSILESARNLTERVRKL